MVVLLVVALMSIVATQLGSRVHLNIQQAGNRAQYEQAYWYALGGERLARGLIEAALQADDRIHRDQAWSSALLSYPIDGGMMQLQIDDQRTCFNLNALSVLVTPQDAQQEQRPKTLRQFERLFQLLDIETARAQSMIEPLRDWLDADTLPTGLDGAEDLFYTNLSPPYLPANGPLVGLSELNFIDGFQPPGEAEETLQEKLARLRALFCALPDTNMQLNLNTLQPDQFPVLAALFQGQLSVDEVKGVMEGRPTEGFADVDAFWSQLQSDEEQAATLDQTVKEQLSVSSDFFLARVEVNYYDSNFILYTRIYVREGKPVTYRRHYGVLNG